jgi:hypothetical protein
MLILQQIIVFLNFISLQTAGKNTHFFFANVNRKKHYFRCETICCIELFRNDKTVQIRKEQKQFMCEY